MDGKVRHNIEDINRRNAEFWSSIENQFSHYVEKRPMALSRAVDNLENEIMRNGGDIRPVLGLEARVLDYKDAEAENLPSLKREIISARQTEFSTAPRKSRPNSIKDFMRDRLKGNENITAKEMADSMLVEAKEGHQGMFELSEDGSKFESVEKNSKKLPHYRLSLSSVPSTLANLRREQKGVAVVAGQAKPSSADHTHPATRPNLVELGESVGPLSHDGRDTEIEPLALG